MIKLGCESQFVNYVHGKFTKGDLISDLKKLMANRCLIDDEYISNEDIRNILVGICKMMGCFDEISSFDNFFEDISPRNYYKWRGDSKYMRAIHPDYDYDMAIIYKTLSMIKLTRVCESDNKGGYDWLFEIDEPDYTILPKYIKEKNAKV